MLSTPQRSLTELTRYLAAHPTDQAALSAVCAALRNGGQVEELIGLLDLHCFAEECDGRSEYTAAELSFRIAKGATDAHARDLCRAALDLCPVHVGALCLFEQLSDPSWRDELCARYQVFLEDAALHGVAQDVIELVTTKLVEAQRETSTTSQDLDDVRRTLSVEGTRNVPGKPLTRSRSEVDGVTEQQSNEVLSIHA